MGEDVFSNYTLIMFPTFFVLIRKSLHVTWCSDFTWTMTVRPMCVFAQDFCCSTFLCCTLHCISQENNTHLSKWLLFADAQTTIYCNIIASISHHIGPKASIYVLLVHLRILSFSRPFLAGFYLILGPLGMSGLSAARKKGLWVARWRWPEQMDHNCVLLWVRWCGRRADIFSSSPLSSDKLVDLKQEDKESILKPLSVVTAKPKHEHEHKQQTTTAVPAVNSRTNLNLFSWETINSMLIMPWLLHTKMYLWV